MMKSIIIEKGLNSHTDMQAILSPIENTVLQYNWLITDYECSCYPDSRITFDNRSRYAWIKGKELLEIVNKNQIQFIWAVFSAFDNNIPLQKILEYEMPYADGYAGFWHNPVGIQHPMAEIEIVAWDSSLTLFIAKDGNLTDKMSSFFPKAQDLEIYNISN